MQVEQKFFIGIQDAGLNNEINNKAILEALTNVTNLHGNLVNQGVNDIKKNHMTWVVLNWKVQVLKRPKVCESIIAKTWAQEYSKTQAGRDYYIYNEAGDIIAKATSKWLAVNIETGRIEKLSEDIMEPYGCETDHNNFPNYEFEKVNEDELQIVSKTKFKVCKSMIDCNNHVHNPAYLDIATEALPSEIDKVNFNNIEVCYKKEIKPEEIVSIEYAIKDNKNYIIIKDEEEKQLHSTIVLY